MTNSYFNFTSPIARFTIASANRLNSILKSVESGFDKLPSVAEINQGARNYSVATYSNGAYSINVPYTVESYAQGQTFTFLSPQQNPGVATLNVNGLGPVTIRRFDGSNLVQGDIRAISINTVVNDGTNFRLSSMHGGSELIATQAATSASTSATQAAASRDSAATSASSAAAAATTAQNNASQAIASLSGARFGFKNILINNLFWMAQRNPAVFSGTNTPNLTFIRDRWRTNGATSWSISNATLTITSGSVLQIIQGRNVPFNGAYTLSWIGTASARVYPIYGQPSFINITNGGNVTLPGFQNCAIEFYGGTVYLPQFEFGSIKTTPELRPVDIDRQICYQYYQKSYTENVTPGQPNYSSIMLIPYFSNVFNYDVIKLHVPMRAIPAITIYSRDGTPGYAYASGPNVRISLLEISDNSFRIISTDNNLVVGIGTYLNWSADAEL